MTSTFPAPRSNYERMSGNCTRIIATQMFSNFSPPIDSSSYILDNACGTGIVTEEIKLRFPPAKIVATDKSASMLTEVQKKMEEDHWEGVETQTADVRDLAAFGEETFSHIVTNLGLPVPGDETGGEQALSEMYRVLKIGGVAMVSTWADRVWLTSFYNTALRIRPHEPPQKFMAMAPELLRASWLATQFEAGGFGANFDIRSCTTYTVARSLDELTDNMMLAKGMFFGGYNDEEMERVRPVLKEELGKARTFESTEGGVRIGMKAWIGTGWKKGDEREVAV